MKAFGVILMVLGIACALCGLYGFYTISQAPVDSIFGFGVDDAISLMRAFGATDYLSFTEKVTLFALENRMILLIGGLISTIGGAIITCVSKKR